LLIPADNNSDPLRTIYILYKSFPGNSLTLNMH
jgi:hypothetical protein